MFKNLLTGKDDNKSKLKTLTDMGFNSSQAEYALDACDGNIERATNFLLSGNASSNNNDQSQPSRHAAVDTDTPRTSYNDVVGTEEEQLQRAVAESLMAATTTTTAGLSLNSSGGRNNRTEQRNVSAAALKAGQAAAVRAENANRRFGANGKVLCKKEKQSTSLGRNNEISTSSSNAYVANSTGSIASKTKRISKHHPNVKIPVQMKDKSKEEQILRCTKRLAPYPLAVDTLLRAFMFIRQNPDEDKYRRINRSTVGFQQALEGKPGAMDLLQAVNFVSRPSSMDLTLDRSRVDMALLYLGISALEKTRESDEYISAKQMISFQKELKIIQSGSQTAETEEVLKRAKLISKLPSEPTGGAGALMQISLGDEKIMRRFDGDDILRDVMHFIGGHGSAIPEKVISREWCLVDLNRYPVVPIETDVCLDKTLQFIGCWPSGRLEVRPSSTKWRESKETAEKMGSSRGLGAAPSSSLSS